MAKKIEQPGVYRGEVFETALQESKNGNPMFVINVRADERYIEHADDLAHFLAHGVITEEVPQWIDWSIYDETAKNFMTLFSPKTAGEQFSEDNATLNYKQVQTAFDWDGTSFDELQSGKFNGHKVLFRVKDEPDAQYGPTTVAWVDAFDAPPQRELNNVDTDKVKDLNNRLAIAKKKPTARPAAAAPKAAPKATRKTKPKTTPAPTAVATPPAPAVAAPVPPVAETPAPVAAPAADITMEQAWEEVYTKAAAAGQEPNVITEAWKATITEIMEELEVDESDFTGSHWAKVRTTALRDLA